MIECDCRATPALCDRCLQDAWMQLRGVAACRGERWGAQLARAGAAPLELEATRRVADIARDARLRVRLAAEALRWARRALERARFAMCRSMPS